MHLLPAERAHLRTIDEHRVCDAIQGIGSPVDVHEWAELFALLGDPGRLALLRAIRRAPDICVTDLAVAVDMRDAAVSQALRLLKAAGVVGQRRDGRVVRYQLIDDRVDRLLEHAGDLLATP